MAENYFLAVDGGGTKTTVWVADENGEKISEGKAGPMSLAATSPEEAIKNFMTAVDQATKGLVGEIIFAVSIGLAGVDTPEEIEHATEFFSKAFKERYLCTQFSVVNDTVIALASGTDSQNAVCLIAGTGSNCLGRNASGKMLNAGGLDYLLADQGSGYDIGQQTLRAAVKSYDHRSKKTLLEKLVCEHFQIDSIAQLKDKVYHPQLNKTQIAELAKICFDAHDQLDATANEIISQAISELILMVSTILKRLDLLDTATDLVLIGGIATDPYTQSQLKVRLVAKHPKLSIIVPDHPPVYGALRLALQQSSK
jgi:N-acetylglucosamine kinase-like BadF-type ATPase